MHPWRVLMFAAGLVTGLATPVVATDTPSSFDAQYEPQTRSVVLSWDAVPGIAPNPTVYTIYSNGQAIATTTSLSYADPLDSDLVDAREYQVTATVDGTESLPSRAITFTKGANPLDPNCPIWTLSIYTSPPGVAPQIRWECVPP